MRAQQLYKSKDFKESLKEFEKCLVRIEDKDSNLTGMCFVEMGLLNIMGVKGSSFKAGDIYTLFDKAQACFDKESMVWGNEHTPSNSWTLLNNFIIKMRESQCHKDTVLASTGYKMDSNGMVMLPLRMIKENGPACACCQLSFERMMKCSRCKKADYFVCGVDCQRKDWMKHKVDCTSS